MRPFFAVHFFVFLCQAGDLESARDRQDRAALAKLATGSPYRIALAQSYLSEVALELRDKREARTAAEAGIAAARQAIASDPNKAEYHRLLGTLCGQVIPADPLAGLQHGKCAKQEIEKALGLDPKSALAWVSSGVGKYYLPAMLGGGLDLALKDFEKATSLNPQLAEAWLWVGLAHRKAGRIPQARQALEKAQVLNPKRIWIKQQLEKTPAP
jgi:tetratricopeptide (TPR) repeat protein